MFDLPPVIEVQADACFSHQDAIKELINKYGEVLAWKSEEPPFELWRNENTWTILILPQPGIACMAASGNKNYMTDEKPGRKI